MSRCFVCWYPVSLPHPVSTVMEEATGQVSVLRERCAAFFPSLHSAVVAQQGTDAASLAAAKKEAGDALYVMLALTFP